MSAVYICKAWPSSSYALPYNYLAGHNVALHFLYIPTCHICIYAFISVSHPIIANSNQLVWKTYITGSGWDLQSLL